MEKVDKNNGRIALQNTCTSLDYDKKKLTQSLKSDVKLSEELRPQATHFIVSTDGISDLWTDEPILIVPFDHE